MNAEQLKNNKIAVQFFRQLKPTVHGTQWDMGEWGQKWGADHDNPCGTGACAAGHLALSGIIEGFFGIWMKSKCGTHYRLDLKSSLHRHRWLLHFGVEVYEKVFVMGLWRVDETIVEPAGGITIKVVADAMLGLIHKYEPGWDPDAEPAEFAEGWEDRLRSSAACPV